MKNLILCVPLVTLALFGCHKNTSPDQASAPSTTGSSAAGGQDAQPLAPAPTHVAARAENTVRETVAGEVNVFLTEQLRAFVQQQGHLPKSFTEFARARLDSIPRPPEGRKWAIDTANLEVKAVPVQ